MIESKAANFYFIWFYPHHFQNIEHLLKQQHEGSSLSWLYRFQFSTMKIWSNRALTSPLIWSQNDTRCIFRPLSMGVWYLSDLKFIFRLDSFLVVTLGVLAAAGLSIFWKYWASHSDPWPCFLILLNLLLTILRLLRW